MEGCGRGLEHAQTDNKADTLISFKKTLQCVFEKMKGHRLDGKER